MSLFQKMQKLKIIKDRQTDVSKLGYAAPSINNSATSAASASVAGAQTNSGGGALGFASYSAAPRRSTEGMSSVRSRLGLFKPASYLRPSSPVGLPSVSAAGVTSNTGNTAAAPASKAFVSTISRSDFIDKYHTGYWDRVNKAAELTPTVQEPTTAPDTKKKKPKDK